MPLSTNGKVPSVTFQLNGKLIETRGDETILQAADRNGVTIPRLCYKDGYRPDAATDAWARMVGFFSQTLK